MENITVNEVESNELKERAYTMHYNYPFKVKAIMSLLSLFTIGIGMLYIYGESLSIYIKGGVTLIYLFFLLKKFYDFKYFLGVKKNLFIIDRDKDMYSYFNEFEGVKTFKLSEMKRIKIFRNKNGIHLIEVITENDKKEQNINVECLSQTDINDMVRTLRLLQPQVEFAENLPPYEVAKAQKEAEKAAKKEKYKNKR